MTVQSALQKGENMRIKSFLNALRDDAGMTTAEYAVGTVAAASLGGLLIKILTGSQVQAMLLGLIEHAFRSFFG